MERGARRERLASSKEEAPQRDVGPIFGIAIILIILIAGAWYFMDEKVQRMFQDTPQESPAPLQDEVADDLRTHHATNTFSAIASDLHDTELANIDAELQEVTALLEEHIRPVK